jgi:hypothetical protein
MRIGVDSRGYSIDACDDCKKVLEFAEGVSIGGYGGPTVCIPCERKRREKAVAK